MSICNKCKIKRCPNGRGSRKYHCGYRSMYYDKIFEQRLDAEDMASEQRRNTDETQEGNFKKKH